MDSLHRGDLDAAAGGIPAMQQPQRSPAVSYTHLDVYKRQALSVIASVTSGNPFLEYIQNGASVAAVMGIFLWREMKRAERYERLYDDERKKRIDAENKCSGCEFVRKAHEEFLDNRD